MTQTKQDLAIRVLTELEIISATETPEHEDAELVKKYYTTKLASLVDDGKAYWPADEIPDAAFTAVAQIMADNCKKAFGKQYENGQIGFDSLVAHISKQSDGQPTVIEYF